MPSQKTLPMTTAQVSLVLYFDVHEEQHDQRRLERPRCQRRDGVERAEIEERNLHRQEVQSISTAKIA